MPHRPVPPHNRALARGMRADMPDAEFRLWCEMRGGRLGLRFRRQQPIAPYIVDFFCAAKKLVVEVDGEQHALGSAPAADRTRTLWLEAQGCTVIRFWTHEIMQDLDGVCAAIIATAEGRWRNEPDR